jgi:hypothetical protein
LSEKSGVLVMCVFCKKNPVNLGDAAETLPVPFLSSHGRAACFSVPRRWSDHRRPRPQRPLPPWIPHAPQAWPPPPSSWRAGTDAGRRLLLPVSSCSGRCRCTGEPPPHRAPLQGGFSPTRHPSRSLHVPPIHLRPGDLRRCRRAATVLAMLSGVLLPVGACGARERR